MLANSVRTRRANGVGTTEGRPHLISPPGPDRSVRGRSVARRGTTRAVRWLLRVSWPSGALAQECQPRAAARRVAQGGSDDGDPPLPLHSARGKTSAASRDDVAIDCSDWRCCGVLACSERTGGVPQRRINFTVFIVLLLFAFIYWTVVFAAALPWLEGSVQGVTHVGIFTLTTAVALVMYLYAVFTDPGSVPPNWVPDVEGAAFVEVKKKGGEPRYCQKCKRHKPPRTHHCRQCDRCVLRMDHHCVWLNNCVGHRNYKAFFLFLLYVTAAVLHGLVLLLSRALSSSNASVTVRQQAKVAAREEAGEFALVEAAAASSATQVMAIVISVPLVVALAMLLGWHVYLVLCNKTTVEYHEGVRAKRTAQVLRRGDGRTSGGESRSSGGHIYDLGAYTNVQAALGPQPFCWLVPGRSADGDGLSFQTS